MGDWFDTKIGQWTVPRFSDESEIENSSQGDASCSPLFVIITLIQKTEQRSTAGYARSSCQSLRRLRALCATIGLIMVRATARPLVCLRTKLVLMSRCI